MAGELGLLVKDADSGVAGEQGQGLADVGVGDGVEIAVEADVGGLAGADDAHEFGLEGMGGERQQPGLLVGPDLGDGAVWSFGMTASRQRRNWALMSSRSRKSSAAKKAWRRYWICRSIFPFSFRVPACRAGGRSGSGRRALAGGGGT